VQRLAGLLLLVGVLLLAATAGWAATGKIFAQHTVSGRSAATVVAGRVKAPTRILVYVLSTPRRPVGGKWAAICMKGRLGKTSTGRLKGRSPLAATIRLPFARPSSCYVSAAAYLRGARGRLTVQLITVK
jgi:hypothetical protein